METTIELNQEQERNEGLAVVSTARQIEVSTAGQYEDAGRFLVFLKGRRRQIEVMLEPSIQKAFEAHKTAVALKKSLLEPYAQAESIVSPAIKRYLAEEERKRREAEAKAQDELRRRQEDDRLAAAERLAKQGRAQEAEQMISAPIITPTVVLPKAFQKVEGLVNRKIWKFRVVDEKIIPREYLQANLVSIGAVVRAMKGATSIPGVEAYEDQTL